MISAKRNTLNATGFPPKPMKLFLRNSFCLLFFALVCFFSPRALATPDTIDGWTFFMVITNATGPFPKSGSFLLSMFDAKNFTIINLSDTANNYGSGDYQNGQLTVGSSTNG